MTRFKTKRAFTIIEIVLVIALVSILTKIYFINNDFINEYRVKESLNKIITDIEYVRNQAINSAKTMEISFNFDDNSYSYNEKETMIDIEIVKPLKLDYSNSNRTKFVFTKNGIPAKDGAGTIALIYKHNLYRISVVPVTGMVNLKRDDI
ncbi:MAG: prepilin-type N-terminal cleavage/methylation domain-containing protein [Tissierellia bacterium]|nr:prepilin-type N-terminal cleavage/methylation domain-containing protein [Tissierellia bacterium]